MDRSTYQREWREKNRERLRAYERARAQERLEYARKRRRLAGVPERKKKQSLAELRAMKQRWVAKNRERVNAQQRERYRKNNDHRRAMDKARREKDKDRLHALWAEYRSKNRDRLRAANREWGQKNREHVRAGYWKHRDKRIEAMFEHDIKALPSNVKEMRRVLVRFRRWLKANGYTVANLTTPKTA